MRHTTRWARVAVLTALCWAGQATRAGTTNTVPWADSFEAYPDGFAVSGTNGWRADHADDGLVTAIPAVVEALAAYPAGGRTYPLPGEPHARVLQVVNDLCGDVRGNTGGVVAVDLMAIAEPVTAVPEDDTDRQYAVCVTTNGHLLLWQRDPTGGGAGVNGWVELASPTLATGVWTRFTILHDYANSLFQVCINGGDPVTNAAGWAQGGVSQPGSWFHMVQTNGALAVLQFSAGATNYVDDVVVTNRSVTWTGGGFAERAANDGRIDTGTVVVLRLERDTFTGETGDDLAADGRVTVTGLPANLAAVARRDSPTQVTLTLTNVALAHESTDSTTNVTVTLTDTACALGAAWDVAGAAGPALDLTFLDTPRLAWDGGAFAETAANDGTLDNTTPLRIDLVHGTFHGVPGEDFGTNGAKVQFPNLPASLAGELLLLNATQLQLRVVGTATAHAAAASVTNVALVFGDAAFDTVPASSVLNAGVALALAFRDPSVLSYEATTFRETAFNDGTLTGTTLGLTRKTFAAAPGEDLVGTGKATVERLPAGLALSITVVDGTNATVAFTGAAAAHGAADGVTNLAVRFADTAFDGGNAAGIEGAVQTDLVLQFVDPVTLTFSANTFSEIAAGLMDNRTPVTVTLTGDTFGGANGDDFVAAGLVVVSNVPPGLSVQVRRDSDTRLSILWSGSAAANATNDSVFDVAFTFQPGAFAATVADRVVGSATGGFTVWFVDDTGFFNVIPYEDPFEAYAAGATVIGTNGWSGDYPDTGLVTNDPALEAGLASYLGTHSSLPADGGHRQVLAVMDSIRTDVHTEGAPLAYLDFMMMPAPVEYEPDADTNRQYAFYVSTNRQLVIWHRRMTGPGPVNEWLTLGSGPLIDTSRWTRFTVAHDYERHRFQVRVNEGAPIVDAAGWTDSGLSTTGSWFHMVQTNASLTAILFSGLGGTSLDDVTVRTRLGDLFGARAGSVFKFR